MMLCLSLRTSPQQVYQRALRQFSVEEITEAFAAARGLALPSQLRRMMRDQGRDLHAEFVRLLPTPPRPIGVQRWSARRVALLLLVLLVLIPAGIPLAWVFAQSSANPGGGAAVTGGSGSCTQIEELWLEAQSVPSASRIPCVRGLPADIAGELSVRDGESVLELSQGSLDINLNTSGGSQASAEGGTIAIRLTATCAVPSSGSAQTIAPDVRRFRLGGPDQTAEVVHIFPGGCVTFRPEPDTGPTESLMSQAERAVTYQPRDALGEALRRRSRGRLQLDPPGENSG